VPLSELMALSLWQPWASLVAIGVKRFETRSWPTQYRGPLLIHASRRWGQEQADWVGVAVKRLGSDHIRALGAHLPIGGYVAIVDLVDCRPTFLLDGGDVVCRAEWFFELTELEVEFGDWGLGRFGWQLENVVRFLNPIPGRGQQGLYRPGPDVLDRVREEVSLATATA